MDNSWELLLNIEGLEITDFALEKSRVYLSCRSKLGEAICPLCLKKCHFIKDTYTREIRDSAICGKELYLRLEVRQFVCKDCNRHFHERFSFVDSYQNFTNRFKERLYDLCKGADFQYVARQENLHWNTIRTIFEQIAQSVHQKQDLWTKVRHLGIDEISLRKGHKNYVIVLVDLQTAVVLDILPVRSKEYLKNYFLKKGEAFCAQIESFCSDMWEGFINCAKEVFPQAEIIADRFHFFAYLQKNLDKCRQSLVRKFKEKADLKSLRWLLLRPLERLNEGEKKQLDLVFAQADYQMLHHIWQARNDFRAILEKHSSKEQAHKHLNAWQVRYSQGEHPYLEKFMKFYQTWKIHILNYFSNRFTTSLIEGINNKLKLIKRRAYGFLNFHSFRLRAIVEFHSS